MSQPIDLSKTPEFAIEEARRKAMFPPTAEIMISWSDGTEAYITVSDKTADRIGALIEDDLGRKFNTN